MTRKWSKRIWSQSGKRLPRPGRELFLSDAQVPKVYNMTPLSKLRLQPCLFSRALDRILPDDATTGTRKVKVSVIYEYRHEWEYPPKKDIPDDYLRCLGSTFSCVLQYSRYLIGNAPDVRCDLSKSALLACIIPIGSASAVLPFSI